MADDVQNKQLLISLNQMRKVSDKTLLAEFDKDALEELRVIEQEMRRGLELSRLDSNYKARIQGEGQSTMAQFQAEAQAIQAKAQARLQQEMQSEGIQQGDPAAQQQAPEGQEPPGGPQQPDSVNVIQLADAYAQRLSKLSPEQAAPILERMKQQNPQLAELVQARLASLRTGGISPMPEQSAPTRGPGSASI